MWPRSLLAIADLPPADIELLLDRAQAQKADPSGPHGRACAGRSLALLFEKPSLRTRVSFELAMQRLGGTALYLSPAEVGLGKREPVKDVARVLGGYCDAIACRTFSQEVLVELADWSGVPVINALSDWEHPCQALADLLTVREQLGGTQGHTLAYVGDGNNVARSLALGAASVGMHVRLASPPAFTLDEASTTVAASRGEASGGSIRLLEDPREAVAGADVVYTDVWTSMGQEDEAAARRRAFLGYQVSRELLALARPGAIVMHDLPAHRGEEITDAAIESEQSVVFAQAENRLHAQQAVLWRLVGQD
ncbi:MAG: ornithine carbamoyltransferase [Chloroflexi bacterium]|nr:ornithine carbamoyltransferase [Chloroflexota bacterium]